MEMGAATVALRLPHDESWVRLYLHKVGDFWCVWPIDFVKHYVAIVGVCEVINQPIPIRLELLTPVAFLHVEVCNDHFVDILYCQNVFEVVKGYNLFTFCVFPPFFCYFPVCCHHCDKACEKEDNSFHRFLSEISFEQHEVGYLQKG